MKLSKLLVSVNVAATIPIVVHTAAGATENKTDTNNWLKESIGSLDKSNSSAHSSSKVTRAVVRAKKEQSIALSDGHSSTLRPFVPNRKLPRRADLESALQAQVPQMAPEPVPTLNGGVSGFYQQSADNTYSSNSYPSYRQSIPPSKISQSSAVGLRPTKSRPEHIAEMTRTLVKAMPMMNQQAAPAMPNHPINAMSDLALSTRAGSAVSPQRGFPMMQQAEHRLLDSGNGAEDESMASAGQSINPNMGSVGEMNAPAAQPSTAYSAGPPPFPLNLLPEASLKQFIRGSMGGGASRAPHVSFGSWHGTNTMARSLPPGGFQNYASGGMRGFAAPNAHRYSSRSLALAPIKHTPSSKRYAIAKQTTVASKPPAEPKVATYAPYAASSRFY